MAAAAGLCDLWMDEIALTDKKKQKTVMLWQIIGECQSVPSGPWDTLLMQIQLTSHQWAHQ